jgi:hypothetical protein
MLAHLDTESYLASLHEKDPQGFNYTVIRIGLYSESYPIYTASFDINNPPADGKIRIPHDGAGPGIAWAKRAELGEAVAKLIATYMQDPETFAYNNKLMVLSGPKEYSLAETAKVFSDVLGREIVIEEVSIDEYANLPAVKVKYMPFSLSHLNNSKLTRPPFPGKPNLRIRKLVKALGNGIRGSTTRCRCGSDASLARVAREGARGV